VGNELIEGFGDQCRIVVVRRGDHEPSTVHPRLPQGRGLGERTGAMPEREREAEPPDGHRAVFPLAASLRRLGRDARGLMQEHDGRLHFVAVLPAGARPLREPLPHLPKQVVDRECRWVHRLTLQFRHPWRPVETPGPRPESVCPPPGLHLAFAAKHRLPFPIISDHDRALRKLFGVVNPLGVIPGRLTYVIDRQGVVRLVFSALFASDEHVRKALAAVAEVG
jgi:hypothetical protein